MEVLFILDPEVKSLLAKEINRRKPLKGSSVNFSTLAKEYIYKGLVSDGLAEKISSAMPESRLEELAKGIIADRMELLELSAKAQSFITSNSLLEIQNASLKQENKMLLKRIKNIEAKPEEPELQTRPWHEYAMVILPILYAVWTKYTSSQAEAAKVELDGLRTNLENLPNGMRNEAISLIENNTIPWPKDLKKDLLSALQKKSTKPMPNPMKQNCNNE